MTEETKRERKYVTVGFPTRVWTLRECMAFEEFCRLNSPEIRRIFIKFGIGAQHHD